ncbi:SAM-dependent methyltransferase [Phytomonospora endophytica]|uniref:SAM-dependent methyltransferase n=1 Tax=Phytomonospora endophytica TaxID=714109 RepID=A0A841FLU6_9ACTN|nr:SAM-dependent methyltransferase [Phytomonospora endophytica]MBB6036834.1 SAM-dependent methyltransferase [Phytomonospora endophytica]GIG68132.1 SAM-dependent methyltransferase [Phytomonospora endophytica]
MTTTDGATSSAGSTKPAFDISQPTIARVYDALLGGKDNFEADRLGAQTYLKYVPDAGRVAQDNRDGLVKGVQYLARKARIDQFLDIGSGLPTVKNTHEAAQEINPAAKVVYVDNDPIVLAHGRALLATNDSTTVVTADLRRPQEILDHPDVRNMLDFDRPIALMVVGLHMHFHDDEQPDEWVRTLWDALVPGSYLFMTDFVDTGEPLQKAIEQAGLESLGNGWIRTPERIKQHFLGLELEPPGLDFVARWFPEDLDADLTAPERLEPWQRIMMAGIARKP